MLNDGPPCGDGNCDVDANSPTATHVEHDRDVWSSRAVSSMYPQRCIELRAISENACRECNAFIWKSTPMATYGPWRLFKSNDLSAGSWVMSLVLKLFWMPSNDDSWAQLRIKSLLSSSHIESRSTIGLRNKDQKWQSSPVTGCSKSVSPAIQL